MENREWEKFYGGPLDVYDERVYVTLNWKGQIYLNRHTWHLLGSPEYVNFYFSRRRDVIMLVKATTRQPESFPVREKQVGYVILASPFCKHYGIAVKQTIQFVRPDLDDHRLKLDLTRTTAAVSSPRVRKDRLNHIPR